MDVSEMWTPTYLLLTILGKWICVILEIERGLKEYESVLDEFVSQKFKTKAVLLMIFQLVLL